MIGWIIFLAFIVCYSVGVTILAKNNGDKRYLLNLIPFASFFYIEKYTGGFKILTIPVKKWGRIVLTMTLVCLGAYLYGLWGYRNLILPDSREALLMIMWLPVAACLIVFWLGTASSTTAVLVKNNAAFKGCTLVSLLLLPAPFLLGFSNKRKLKLNCIHQ